MLKHVSKLTFFLCTRFLRILFGGGVTALKEHNIICTFINTKINRLKSFCKTNNYLTSVLCDSAIMRVNGKTAVTQILNT